MQNQHSTHRSVTAYNRNGIEEMRAYVGKYLGQLYRFLIAHTKQPVSKSPYDSFYIDALEPILVTQKEAAIGASILQKLHPPSDSGDSSASNFSNARVLPSLPLIVWGTLDKGNRKTSTSLTSLVAASESMGRMLEDICQQYGIPHLRLETLDMLRELYHGQVLGPLVMGLLVTKVKPEYTGELEIIQRESWNVHEAIASLIRYRQEQEQHDEASSRNFVYGNSALASSLSQQGTLAEFTNSSSGLPVSRHAGQEEIHKRKSSSNHRDADFPVAIAESSKAASYYGPSRAIDVAVYPDGLDSGSAIAAKCSPHSGHKHDESPSWKKQRTQDLPSVRPQVATFLETSKQSSEGLLFAVAATKTSPTMASEMSPSADSKGCDVADKCLGIDTVREEEKRAIKKAVLEAQITMFETVLKFLEKRKQSLAQETRKAEDHYHHLMEQTPSLESHISNLKSTINYHTNVHNKLLCSLGQSHSLLARLSGSYDDVTVEEITQLTNELETADREVEGLLAALQSGNLLGLP